MTPEKMMEIGLTGRERELEAEVAALRQQIGMQQMTLQHKDAKQVTRLRGYCGNG